MARWTETLTDIRHYAKVSTQYIETMGLSPKLRVTLLNGTSFEGYFGKFSVHRSHPGNQYSGEFEVIDPSTQEPVLIDMLDVEKIEAA